MENTDQKFYCGTNGREYLLEPPRRRGMNDDATDDFVAVDFETATQLKTSACAIGMVKVIDGVITQQFYSLINPVRDEYTDQEPYLGIHGLSLNELEKAATFGELFDNIRQFIGGLPLVCHNKAADIPCFETLMQYYGRSGIVTSTAKCTYALTGLSLEKCCEKFGIPLDNHHNALWDAEACARIYLAIIGKPIQNNDSFSPFGKAFLGLKKQRNVSKEFRVKLDDSDVENKDTPFYNSRVVITGVFDAYPERDSLAELLQKLGAKVNSGITGKTTHVVLGRDAGPKKIEKISELRSQGVDIRVIEEPELVSILSAL